MTRSSAPYGAADAWWSYVDGQWHLIDLRTVTGLKSDRSAAIRQAKQFGKPRGYVFEFERVPGSDVELRMRFVDEMGVEWRAWFERASRLRRELRRDGR